MLEVLLSKSGDDLLSHKRNEVEFVGAGGDRSHAAPAKLVPVRVAKWTAPPGEEDIDSFI